MLSTVEKILFLKSINLFEKLPGAELAHVSRISEEVSFRKGELLMQEGEMGDALYLIVDGEVEIILKKNNKVLARLGKGEPIGEMGILDSAPRSASVIALTDVETLKIEQEAFDELMTDRLEIAQGVIRVLIKRLRNLSDALAAASASPAPESDSNESADSDENQS
jgi:CRP-like cAMP-binding protein